MLSSLRLPAVVAAGVVPNKTRLAASVARAMIIGSGALMAAPTYAQSYQLGDELSVDWDTHVRYSAAWRAKDPNAKLLVPANANGDDGNRAFKKGALIQNRFDVLSEADFKYQNLGLFVRGRGYYDDVYHRSNDHDSPATSNNVSVAHDEFTRATRKEMGSKAELLDHFVYGDFNIGDRALNLRVGSQVVSWGESLLILGGAASSQVPLDATALNIPGVELREVFLPVGTVYGQFDLTPTVSLEAYYQYEWDKTRIDAAGSYFSTVDLLDEGGESLLHPLLGQVPRGEDVAARDSGQWGVAVRYLAEELNFTEFSLFYMNYHNKTPQVAFAPAFSDYHLTYEEDIHLAGISAGTVIGTTNVGAELTYRSNAPVAVGGLGTAPERAKVLHATANMIHLFPAQSWVDSLSFMGEIAVDRVLDRDNDELAADRTAWSYAGTITPEWASVMPGVDLALPVSFTHNPNGVSAIGSFSEGKDKVSIKARLRYKQRHELNIGYTAFLGSASDNNQADRDFYGISLKTSF